MLLSALLLAAAVQIVQPSPREAAATGAAGVSCGTAIEYAVARPVAGPLKATKLSDLPAANHTLTVLRSVDGCPVSSTVRFNVDRPARSSSVAPPLP